MKEFTDGNSKFDENGWKVLQIGRKHCGKRINCSLRAISPFPTVLSKYLYCRHVKTRACLGKGKSHQWGVAGMCNDSNSLVIPLFIHYSFHLFVDILQVL